MKKKLVPLMLIVTVVIIILSVVVFYQYIRPMYNNNIAQFEVLDLAKKDRLAFGKYTDQEGVFGIEIEISGQASSNFNLTISNSETTMHIAAVKGKNVDFIYKNDWYDDSCFLDFSPRGKKSGKLEVSVRFLAID